LEFELAGELLVTSMLSDIASGLVEEKHVKPAKESCLNRGKTSL